MMPGESEVPAVDPGNRLLALTPAQLTTAYLDTPDGQRLALTIRTTSTTLTVLLNSADARNWAALLNQGAAGMSAAGLVVSKGNVQPNGGGRPA